MTLVLVRKEIFQPHAEHQHPDVELLYLISGKLELTIGSKTFNLESGDAVYFDSGVRHSYHRASKSPCTSVIVTA